MDVVAVGLSIRALRRQHRWTQRDLGLRAALGASSISRIERGLAGRYSLRTIDRVTDALGARLSMRVLWQGEALDRLLDAEHARMVESTVHRLHELRWVAVPEVTFQIGAERGSVDILAWHPTSRQLLVVEVKTVMPDVQALLAGIDRKARLGRRLGEDQGWDVAGVSRMLMLPDDRTARRRLTAFASTFDAVLPARTVQVRQWLRAPRAPIAGVLFLSSVHHAGARHRVRPPQLAVERGRTERS